MFVWSGNLLILCEAFTFGQSFIAMSDKCIFAADTVTLFHSLYVLTAIGINVTETGKPEVVSNGTGPLACLSLFPVAGLDKVS